MKINIRYGDEILILERRETFIEQQEREEKELYVFNKRCLLVISLLFVVMIAWLFS